MALVEEESRALLGFQWR